MTTAVDALARLERLADEGALAAWCDRQQVSLLVVFGSAVDPDWGLQAEDLDVR